MKNILGIIGIFCAIVIFGRIIGVGGQQSVFLSPDAGDGGVVSITTGSGYFMTEVLKGGKWHLHVNGFDKVLTVPEEGIYIFEADARSAEKRGLESAIRDLQTVTGAQ